MNNGRRSLSRGRWVSLPELKMQFKSILSVRLDGHMLEVINSASSALAIRIFGTFLGFTVSVLIARLLGAEGTGIYYLAISVTTIAATIGRVGFDNTVVRFIASHASVDEWADVRFVYRTTLKVVAAASMLASIVLFLGADWMANTMFGKPFMVLPLRLASVAVLPLALAMIQAESLRGLKSIPASQWIKTVFISLGTLMLLYPFTRLWAANGAIAAYAVAVTFTATASWTLWRKAWCKKAGINATVRGMCSIKSLFQSSWPLFGVALAGLIMQQAATIFLGAWGTVTDVGVFNVANRIASLLLFPLLAMISILTPKFAAMHRQGDMESLMHLARASSRILSLVAIPVAIMVAMGAKWILILFGPDFSNGVTVLDVLLVGVVINASTGAVAELLMMSGYEKTVSVGVAFSAIISLILCLILIPKYGQVGAAIAVASGMAIQNLFMLAKVRTKLGFWPIALIS